ISRSLLARIEAPRARTACAAATSAAFFCAVGASASTVAAFVAARPSSSISSPMCCVSISSRRRLRRAHCRDARSLLTQQHQVVAVNHLVASTEAEELGDLGGLAPHDACRVAIGVRNDAARDLRAIAGEHAHGVATVEAPARSGDTGG